MDGLDRRRLLGMVAGAGIAGLTGALTGCTATSAPSVKPTLRIGLLTPTTGSNKSVGADLDNGFKLYLEMMNGMFSGHEIKVVPADEGDTLESGEAALQELLDQQVLAVVGVANPEVLPKVQGMIEAKQVPLVATHAAPSLMASAFHIWRTGFLNNEPARAIAAYLKRRSAGKVGLIGLQDALTAEVHNAFVEELGNNASAPIFVTQTGEPTKEHFGSAVSQLRASGARAVYLQLPSKYIVPLLQALRNAGFNSKEVYASGLASEGAALGQLGNRADGLLTSMHYSADLSNAANRDFSALYLTKHRASPNAFVVAAFDAAAVLDRAIALCGNNSVTSQRVNQMIGNVGQIVSPRGNWQFNQGRSPQQKWYLRRVGNDGPVLSNVLISDLVTLG